MRGTSRATARSAPTEAARISGSGGLPGRAWRRPGWRVLVPAVVATLALVIGGLALSGAFTPTRSGTPSGGVASAPQVRTTTLVNASGGYRLTIPAGMRAERSGSTTRLRTADRSLVMTVLPAKRVDPALGNAQVLRAMESGYRSVRTVRHEALPVDGLRAVTSYGVATTKQGTRLRFVLVSILGARSTYAISAFAAADADPATVLPRVRAVVNGFQAQ